MFNQISAGYHNSGKQGEIILICVSELKKVFVRLLIFVS